MEALVVGGGVIAVSLSVVKTNPKETSSMIVSLPVDTLRLALGFEPWAS
ncbi:MAG: hypothetical protein AAF572_05195 [Cyanobacteria bacterium P01_B01_bin.77]